MSTACRAWFCARPRRRLALLAAYALHEMLVARPLRALGCGRCRFDQDDLEERAITAYLSAKRGSESESGPESEPILNTSNVESEQRRAMKALLARHASHREALARTLPGMWAWYPMGRLIYATALVQALCNKLALLDFEAAGGADGAAAAAEAGAAEAGGAGRGGSAGSSTSNGCSSSSTSSSSSGSRRGSGGKLPPTSSSLSKQGTEKATPLSSSLSDHQDDLLFRARLPPTVWVVGLPRTGSTFFHQLLNLDPATRCLRQWELRAPVACSPAVRRGDVPDDRLAKAREGDKFFQLVFGALQGIHFVTSGQVDECVQGFVDAAMPEYFLWGCRDMPEAFEWYTSRAHASCHTAQYENFRRLIAAVLLAGVPRTLGGGGTGADGIYGGDVVGAMGEERDERRLHQQQRQQQEKDGAESSNISRQHPNRADGNAFQCVALKSPHHSVKLTTIAEVFGDTSRRTDDDDHSITGRPCQKTVFVWLHRSLEAVVGSTCSMNAAVNACMTSLFEETPAALGRRTLDCLARSMDIAVRQRRELEARAEAPAVFIDVFHEDLRKDPVAVVQRVYRKAGLEVSAAFRASLEQRAAEERAKTAARKQQAQQQSQHQQRHRYSLAKYGLAQGDVDAAFAVYNTLVRDVKKKSAGGGGSAGGSRGGAGSTA